MLRSSRWGTDPPWGRLSPSASLCRSSPPTERSPPCRESGIDGFALTLGGVRGAMALGHARAFGYARTLGGSRPQVGPRSLALGPRSGLAFRVPYPPVARYRQLGRGPRWGAVCDGPRSRHSPRSLGLGRWPSVMARPWVGSWPLVRPQPSVAGSWLVFGPRSGLGAPFDLAFLGCWPPVALVLDPSRPGSALGLVGLRLVWPSVGLALGRSDPRSVRLGSRLGCPWPLALLVGPWVGSPRLGCRSVGLIGPSALVGVVAPRPPASWVAP